MSSHSDTSRSQPRFPRFALALLAVLVPRPERDELMADIREEYVELAATSGDRAARRWLWRQTLRSAPQLLRWSVWRGRTGFEPHANAFRPGGSVLKNWIADARYAGRRLRNRPGYTVLAVLTLSLGIGGTAAVFGIARPLILDPLPYAHADEVGFFWRAGWWTEEEYLYLRDKFSGYRAVAAYRPGDLTMREGDAPARLIPGITASSELFDVLGAHPLLGRTFQTGDDVQGAEPVVVISHSLWVELGGTPSIVGRRLTLDGTARTVVGVMPRGFWFPSPDIRIWHPRPLNPQGRNGSYAFLGRVNPGEDAANMGAHVKRLTQTIGERFTYSQRADKTKDAWVKPLRDELLGSMKPAVVATFVAMALILLIACVNVAALMLGQVEGRSAELAVRSALGATRARITQQLVVEALILGLLAGATGAALAAVGFRLLAQALPIGAWGDNAAFDWTMFAVAMAIAVLAVLLVVIIPLVSLWRGQLRDALSRARTGGVHGRGGRLERGLVVTEVALAMLIASGAAVLVRSVSNLYDINPGVDTNGVAVVDVLTRRDMDGDRRIVVIDQTLAALTRVPGARYVAAGMRLPLRGGGDSFGITVEGREAEARSFTYFRVVSPAWFQTMGIRTLDGRTFDASDLPDTQLPDSAEMAVVINEALAKKYFPGENPIGRRLRGGFARPQRIIGIVSNVAEGPLTDELEPVRYYLHTQAWFGAGGSFVVRAMRHEDTEAVLDLARTAVQRAAPEFAVQSTTTMERIFDAAVGPARQVMTLLTLLSALALVLGAIGIYGVISHFAARRQRDWAIRVALGMPGSRVIKLIVQQGVALAIFGILLGAIAAVGLTRLLSTFLFGVTAVDPLAYGIASAALVAIGAAAAFVPAWRAGTVDPALVLREQ